MANNILNYLLGLKTKDPNRANWPLDYDLVGSNDFGFWKVRHVDEVIAGTNYKLNFRAAFSTNPTISPVLSRAKVQVVAIWVPTSLYVPALRDGVEVKPGKTDYSFPAINFDYPILNQFYASQTPNTLLDNYGSGMPYIPEGSIFSELGMWRPNFQPIGFLNRAAQPQYFPEPKNAIPYLGYLDFIRNYVLNTQDDAIPMRVRTFTPESELYPSYPSVYGYASHQNFDELFREVRLRGGNYLQGDFDGYVHPFDITDSLKAFFRNLVVGSNDYSERFIYGPFPSKNVLAIEGGGYAFFSDNHFGEFTGTFRGDSYTAFLSNENVEYERSIARVTVQDDGGSQVITMEQIYAAQRVQNFIRRSVFKNSDYAEYIEDQYGVRPPTNLTKPLFLGSVSTWLSWNDVVSQSQTGDDDDIESKQSLGSRASLGFGRMVTGKYAGNGNRNFVSFTAREPGYVIVLENITPEVAYYEGFNPIYDKRSLGSLFYPAFEKDGYQDKQFKYLVEQVFPDSDEKYSPIHFDDFNSYNVAYAQELAWQEYMVRHNKVTGQMTQRGVYRPWTFIRNMFISDSVTSSRYDHEEYVRRTTSTYVLPEDFNYIFANNQGLDNFQCYYSFDINAYQPISHRFQSF